MPKKRKATELSINVVIAAVIGLVALLVLVAILTGKIGGFSKSAEKIQSCDELCKIRGYASGNAVGGTAGYEILIGTRDSDGKQCYCRK